MSVRHHSEILIYMNAVLPCNPPPLPRVQYLRRFPSRKKNGILCLFSDKIQNFPILVNKQATNINL